MSSDGSSDEDVTSACGDVEICAVGLIASFVPAGFRGFFAMVALRDDDWRLPVFLVAAGASGSGDNFFTVSAVFVFFGTAIRWLNDSNSFIVEGVLRKCFLADGMRSVTSRII